MRRSPSFCDSPCQNRCRELVSSLLAPPHLALIERVVETEAVVVQVLGDTVDLELGGVDVHGGVGARDTIVVLLGLLLVANGPLPHTNANFGRTPAVLVLLLLHNTRYSPIPDETDEINVPGVPSSHISPLPVSSLNLSCCHCLTASITLSCDGHSRLSRLINHLTFIISSSNRHLKGEEG